MISHLYMVTGAKAVLCKHSHQFCCIMLVQNKDLPSHVNLVMGIWQVMACNEQQDSALAAGIAVQVQLCQPQ